MCFDRTPVSAAAPPFGFGGGIGPLPHVPLVNAHDGARLFPGTRKWKCGRGHEPTPHCAMGALMAADFFRGGLRQHLPAVLPGTALPLHIEAAEEAWRRLRRGRANRRTLPMRAPRSRLNWAAVNKN